MVIKALKETGGSVERYDFITLSTHVLLVHYTDDVEDDTLQLDSAGASSLIESLRRSQFQISMVLKRKHLMGAVGDEGIDPGTRMMGFMLAVMIPVGAAVWGAIIYTIASILT